MVGNGITVHIGCNGAIGSCAADISINIVVFYQGIVSIAHKTSHTLRVTVVGDMHIVVCKMSITATRFSREQPQCGRSLASTVTHKTSNIKTVHAIIIICISIAKFGGSCITSHTSTIDSRAYIFCFR